MPRRPATTARRPSRGATAMLARLARLRRLYGGEATAEKLRLLAGLGEARPLGRRALEELHQHLLFLRAFPDDARVLSAADTQLQGIAARVRALAPAERRRLDDSGIAGSVTRHAFEAPIVDWLVRQFPDAVEIDWAGLESTAGLEFLLRFALARAEEDGFESGLDTRAWLRLATGRDGSAIAWLLRHVARRPAVRPLWPALWEQSAVSVAWQQRGPGSVTLARLDGVPVVYRRAMRRPAGRAPRQIARPRPAPRPLARAEARRVIDVVRKALSARCREVYGVTHANPDEVYWCDLGEGTAVVVLGVVPEMRLSLESNYGYLLLSNGVPIGYGGVTALFRQANTGINIFDPFRGSEAAVLWIEALRAFRQLLGVHRFIVNPYQFGAGNSEAIASGAFWFYYQLGFRPTDRAVRALAAAEDARRTAQPGHRTDRRTLQRLAGGDLELVLPGARAADRFPERWLGDLGLAATAALAAERAPARLARTLGRALGLSAAAGRGPARTGLRLLAPLLASLGEPSGWSPAERRTLAALVRLKGAPRELGFVQAARQATGLYRRLAALARERSARR